MATVTTNPTKPAGVTMPTVRDAEYGDLLWIGATLDAPFHCTRIKGVTFQKETFAIVRDGAGNPLLDERSASTKVDNGYGQLARITPALAALLKEQIDDRVCSAHRLPDKVNVSRGEVVEANRVRSRVSRKSAVNYQRVEGEEPIGRYLYILPAEDRSKYGRGQRPPTLLPK